MLYFIYFKIFFYTDQLSSNVGLALFAIYTGFLLSGQDVLFYLQINIPTGAAALLRITQTTPNLHQLMFNSAREDASFELYFYALAPFLLKRKRLVLVVVILLFYPFCNMEPIRPDF
ncbi:MAG: hypothetical protein R2827_08880 [Bdellovibrionales bacterium]